MIEKAEPFYIDPFKDVTVVETGQILRVKAMKNKTSVNIKKISNTNYIDLGTGEYKEYSHKNTTRADNIENVRKSFKSLRDIINTNIVDIRKVLLLTLTYAENMQDVAQLYDDFRKFNMRFKSFCEKNNYPHYEYICVVEPQGRGAWHCHVLLLFEKKAPYIPNDKIASIWKLGFTKTEAIKSDVNDIGRYLTAYLTDVELSDISDIRLLNDEKYINAKHIEAIDINGNKVSKCYIKGLRLKMYPKSIKVFRTSRGIKRPKIYKCKKYEADKIVKSAEKTFESTISIKDDNGIEINRITNFYYNKKRNGSANIKSLP